MNTSDFFFELPENLIAQYPPQQRGNSRLMVLDRARGTRSHRMVSDLPEILKPGDLLVFNNSKVRKARLLGRAVQSGAAVEFLLLEKTAANGTEWKCMAQRAKRRRPGSQYVFFDGNPPANNSPSAPGAETAHAEITACDGEYRILSFDRPIDDAWLEQHGHIPLPPYIKRQDAPADAERYQTVYAAATGSSAAPTAGLHFTRELLDRLAAAGIESAFVTLHVGLGTFLPVRSQRVEDHVMHREFFSIDEAAAARIEQAKAEGRRIVAVGTTSARTLESAWDETAQGGRNLRRGDSSTSIFMYPGYRFKVVDALFTNFHTPLSSLLMLVAAFAGAANSGNNAASGTETILAAYAEAVRENYRFFSYGDAMLMV